MHGRFSPSQMSTVVWWVGHHSMPDNSTPSSGLVQKHQSRSNNLKGEQGMEHFVIAVHVLLAIGIVALVMLQQGKGAEMGASFGSSGSQSVFGAGGGSTFLSKMTTGAAVIFMLTSLTLAYVSGQPSSSSIMSKSKPAAAVPAQHAPAEPAAPVQSTPTNLPSAPAAPAQPQK